MNARYAYLMFAQPVAHHYEVPSVGSQVSHPSVVNKIKALKDCLRNCYGIEPQLIDLILSKWQPLLENSQYHALIDDFIEKTKKLMAQGQAKKSEECLPQDDAVVQAPKWHKVLFENSSVRVLWIESNPGDKEPFHTHHWKSLMVITHPGTFETIYADGSSEEDFSAIGVYELPGETSPSTYKNIGDSPFKALRFEMKS